MHRTTALCLNKPCRTQDWLPHHTQMVRKHPLDVTVMWQLHRHLMKWRREEMLQRSSSWAGGVLILTQLLLRKKERQWDVHDHSLRYSAAVWMTVHLHEAWITSTTTAAVTIQACNSLLYLLLSQQSLSCVASISHPVFSCEGKAGHIHTGRNTVNGLCTFNI